MTQKITFSLRPERPKVVSISAINDALQNCQRDLNDSVMLLQAKWIVPVSAPPIENGWIRVDDGIIVEMGQGHPTDLADTFFGSPQELAVFPGLINTHAHLEFGRGEYPCDSFASWAQSVQASQQRDTESALASRWAGNLQRLAETGTTTVINHCNRLPEQIPPSPPFLKGGNQLALHIIHVCEIVGSEPMRAAKSYRDACAQQLEILNDHGNASVSPTSLYAVAPQVLDSFIKNRDPHQLVSIHIKESCEENDLFNDKRGALAQLVKVKGGGLWLSDPITWLREKRLLGPNTLIIHGNYLNETDWGTLQGAGASVIHCPGSHAYFGHQRFPLEALLERDINVALGTDSLASNDDLSLLKELRRVQDKYPALSPEEIVKLATINGANALNMADARGSLEVGKSADMIAVSCEDSDPYEALLAADRVKLTMVNGEVLFMNAP